MRIFSRFRTNSFLPDIDGFGGVFVVANVVRVANVDVVSVGVVGHQFVFPCADRHAA